MPQLLDVLKRKAPQVSLVVKNTGHTTGLRLLEDGGAELIVGNFPPPPHMRERPLYRDGFVCAARAGHPALQGKLGLKRYLSLDHIQVSTSGEPHGYIDAVLERAGAARKVPVTVGHFLVAPLLLRDTDLVATEPRRLLAPLAARFNLALKPPPFAIPPFGVTQMWHARHDADAAHAWLRETIDACCKEK